MSLLSALSLSLSASCACSSVDSSVAPLSWNYSPLQITKCCYTIQRTLLFQINTLHNTKRLGPFLGFGCNFGEKQNKCLKTDPKSVCLMWFVQVFCLFASWANPNHLVNYTQNPKTDPNKVYDVCPNLSVSRHSSCFTQKLYPKPKNGPKRLVKCKVFIWSVTNLQTLWTFRHCRWWCKLDILASIKK